MSERLPYEVQMDQQWDDLPLPDVNMAWADMKRRLEKDDSRKPLAWWRRGCLLWALLLAGLLAAGWLLLKPEKWFRKKEMSTGTTTTAENKKGPAVIKYNDKDGSLTTNGPAGKTGKDDSAALINTNENDSLVSPLTTNERPGVKNPLPVNNSKPVISENSENKTVAKKKQVSAAESGNEKARKPKRNLTRISGQHSGDKKNTRQGTSLPKDTLTKTTAAAIKDSGAVKGNDISRTDTVKRITPDSLIAKKPVSDSVKKQPDEKKEMAERKKTPFLFSAGLGLHQQLPIAGQKFTPYSSQGRKAGLADYIPSVYARMEKEKKWFLQAEFRYGAPQYTKQFTYRQATVPDSGSNPAFSTVTSSALKKTFYHQLPLTFNYYIRPGWSAGIGVQWNKFSSAISEREVSRRNNFTQTESVISKNIIKEDTAGSVFRKNYWQFVLESQYHWKRFSFGAKYSFGLQPYIRFTLPGQPERQERNHTLQVFIRFDLWKQKK